MKVFLDEQAKRLADKDRIPLDTIGVYTDTCGTSYYWVHAIVKGRLLFEFDECQDTRSGLEKAKNQLK